MTSRSYAIGARTVMLTVREIHRGNDLFAFSTVAEWAPDLPDFSAMTDHESMQWQVLRTGHLYALEKTAEQAGISVNQLGSMSHVATASA